MDTEQLTYVGIVVAWFFVAWLAWFAFMPMVTAMPL